MKLLREVRARLGSRGERLAAGFLRSKGYVILARNWRIRAGELDLVARDGETLVFVEVKTLHRPRNFRPVENLSWRQQFRNVSAGQAYYRLIGCPALPVRYDLLEVVFSRRTLHALRHWENFLDPTAFLHPEEFDV